MIFLNLILLLIDLVSAKKFEATPRIINGTIAKPGQFPFTVALLDKENVLICTGNLIFDWLVLTAAHCLGHFTHVLAGDTKINGTSDSRQIRSVAHTVGHHCYEHSPNTYDLALVFVNEPFILSEFVKPADLCEETPRTGEVCTNAGWGNVDPKNKTGQSNDLLYHRLKILGFMDCSLKLLFDGLVCAGSSDSRPCYGDSGGPLICGGKLCGVTSARIAVGRPYNMFGNVAYSRGWIFSNGTSGDPLSLMHVRKTFMFKAALSNLIILIVNFRFMTTIFVL